MRIEAAKLLFDIASAARRVLEFTTGSNYENYSQSPLLRSAVERQFTVLGEAMSQLLRIEPELRAWIPECAAVIGFRNILIHGYAEGDPRIVWSIIQDKVPELLRRVNEFAFYWSLVTGSVLMLGRVSSNPNAVPQIASTCKELVPCDKFLA